MPLAPFGKGKGLRFGGWINAIIPILIVPYYSVIGGWVIRYLSEYVSGHGSELAQDGYFSGFISSGLLAEVCFLLFTFLRWSSFLPVCATAWSGFPS